MQENIKTTVRAKETQQAAGDRAPSRPSLKGAQAAATAPDHVRARVLLHPRQADFLTELRSIHSFICHATRHACRILIPQSGIKPVPL